MALSDSNTMDRNKRTSTYKSIAEIVYVVPIALLVLILPALASAQRVAFLTPERSQASISFTEKLEIQIAYELTTLDDSLSEAAYLSVLPKSAFNMTADEAKRIGSAIGCDAFILLRSATQRRSAFRRAEYYESYAAVFVVSTRTGRLIFWKLQQFEATKPTLSAALLDDSIAALSREIASNIRSAIRNEINEPARPAFEEVPDTASPAAIGFRPPIPYRRIKPEYTTQAALYDIAATVEVLVDLDNEGKVLRTEIVRWAGFGLDHSAEAAIRSMNWRPAERNGKTLPMRFLVRYNFKKIDKNAAENIK